MAMDDRAWPLRVVPEPASGSLLTYRVLRLTYRVLMSIGPATAWCGSPLAGLFELGL